MLAAKRGHADIVKLLLSVHAQRWPEQSLGSEAMSEAARNGKTDIIPLLVEAGVKVEATQAFDRMSPLHFAAMNMHADTVKCLLDTTEIDVNICDKYGWTAPDWATRSQKGSERYSQDNRIKEMLLDRGASPSSQTVEVLANPPHAFLKTFQCCSFSPEFALPCNPISFRCDWDSIGRDKKIRDLPLEKGCTFRNEIMEMSQGWSYNRPQPLQN